MNWMITFLFIACLNFRSFVITGYGDSGWWPSIGRARAESQYMAHEDSLVTCYAKGGNKVILTEYKKPICQTVKQKDSPDIYRCTDVMSGICTKETEGD